MNHTQLSDFRTFDANKNLIFSKPEIGSIGNSVPKITFKRIRLSARNPDGTIGDLVLNTASDLLSFGLQENVDMTTGKANGYSFPICLWSRTGATEEEKLFVTQFDRLVEVCKNYLVAHREELEKYDLELADLKKFNPLYWKMDKGKIVEDRGPMLYVKVLENKKTDKISTLFIDDATNQILNPMELLNKRCLVSAAVKIESIFIGNKISLQVKLYEAVVKVVDTTIRGLLRPVTVNPEATAELPEPEPTGARGVSATFAFADKPGPDVTHNNEMDREDEDNDEEEETDDEEDEEDSDTDRLELPPTMATAPAQPAPVTEPAVPAQAVTPPVASAPKRGGGGRRKATT